MHHGDVDTAQGQHIARLGIDRSGLGLAKAEEKGKGG
jgi:hypothetical protein